MEYNLIVNQYGENFIIISDDRFWLYSYNMSCVMRGVCSIYRSLSSNTESILPVIRAYCALGVSAGVPRAGRRGSGVVISPANCMRRVGSVGAVLSFDDPVPEPVRLQVGIITACELSLFNCLHLLGLFDHVSHCLLVRVREGDLRL